MIPACDLLNFRMNKIVQALLLAIALMTSGCAFNPAPVDDMDTAVLEHPEQFLVLAVHNDGDSGSLRTGSIARGYEVGSGYSQSARARQLLRHIAHDYRLQSISSWPIQALGMQCVVFKPLNAGARDELIAKLQHDPRVLLAQPLNSFSSNTNTTSDTTGAEATRNQKSNDTYVSLQQGMQRMDINAAHRWSRGRGVNIAVIDTGMDSTHPDLKGRISEQHNFVGSSNSRFELDRHGTAVAGVMAANLNNNTGIVGVAPEARLFALKACWQLQADRDDARCNSFTLAQALASAIDLHAHIINLSVVGPDDRLLAALIKQAQLAGIIVVGAADSNGEAAFPSHIPGVIGVVAMEQSSTASDSNQLVTAPGRDVLTLTPGGRYDFSSGSSIATAEISGTVALLLATQPRSTVLNSDLLYQLLRRSTERNATDQFASVNACRALSQLLRQPGCDHPPSDTKSALQSRRQ